MITIRIYDKDAIKQLLASVWDNSIHSGDLSAFTPIVDNLNCWVIVSDYVNIVGIAYIQQITSITVELHSYLLSKKGKGREMNISILKYLLSLGAKKVNVSIPTKYKATYNTAKKIGFKDEGLERLSFTDGETIYDRFKLGITAQEIEGI